MLFSWFNPNVISHHVLSSVCSLIKSWVVCISSRVRCLYESLWNCSPPCCEAGCVVSSTTHKVLQGSVRSVCLSCTRHACFHTNHQWRTDKSAHCPLKFFVCLCMCVILMFILRTRVDAQLIECILLFHPQVQHIPLNISFLKRMCWCAVISTLLSLIILNIRFF